MWQVNIARKLLLENKFSKSNFVQLCYSFNQDKYKSFHKKYRPGVRLHPGGILQAALLFSMLRCSYIFFQTIMISFSSSSFSVLYCFFWTGVYAF